MRDSPPDSLHLGGQDSHLENESSRVSKLVKELELEYQMNAITIDLLDIPFPPNLLLLPSVILDPRTCLTIFLLKLTHF